MTKLKINAYKKKSIPKSLRNQVWIERMGEKFDGKCYCCLKKITVFDWECGHIVSEKNGGHTIIKNLRPICQPCNRSMGIMNMDEFKNKFFPKKSFFWFF